MRRMVANTWRLWLADIISWKRRSGMSWSLTPFRKTDLPECRKHDCTHRLYANERFRLSSKRGCARSILNRPVPFFELLAARPGSPVHGRCIACTVHAALQRDPSRTPLVVGSAQLRRVLFTVTE